MSRWRNVRIFLSSTFRDMHAERDYLIRFTFPALRERLLPHRVELYDIDLRWGITEDEAQNQKVISLCLDQVDQCRPFFLAFLGDRYGWIPDEIDAETRQRFPWVDRFTGVSVTELELRHGVLTEDQQGHSLVLLRNQDALESVPGPIRKRDFAEETPEVREKLEQLKSELQACPYPVQPYSARWNGKTYDRVNRTRGKFEGLEEFGRQVEEWLWNAIQTELQLPQEPAEVDPQDAESDLHERFLELRTRIYVGRDALYHQLKAFALEDGVILLLLTGESGSGKSAALARFVRDFRKEHPDVCTIAHFVGASPDTTSLPTMLSRLTAELVRRFELTLPPAESVEAIIQNFTVAITSIPEQERVVLVFDALNQIDADERADTLIWLPESLPENVRILCSAATGPQQTPRVLSAFGEREFVDLPMLPLTEEERREMIRTVPKVVAKTLDDKQINMMLANPATKNPLYLMVALEELRGYGSYENLNGMIARLPSAGDTLTALFERVFQRLEKEFGQQLVQRTLTLLSCARNGLAAAEFEALTVDLGETADVFPLLRQLEPYLHRRAGHYDFYHMSIRRAVEILYLQWDLEEDQQDPWLRWNPDRDPPAADPSEPEMEARDRLIEHFQKDRLAIRTVEELPWQLLQLRSWQDLFDLFSDLDFFSLNWEANQYEVQEAWSMLHQLGGLTPAEAYRDSLFQPEHHDPHAIWYLALFLMDVGEGELANPAWSYLISCLGTENREQDLQACLCNQALILKAQGDLSGAMELHKQQEEICRRLNNPDGLQRTLGNQALILQAQGDLSGAMELHKQKEEICRRLNNPESLIRSLANQALYLIQDFSKPQQAWPLIAEAVQLVNQHGYLQLAPQVQAIADAIQEQLE